MVDSSRIQADPPPMPTPHRRDRLLSYLQASGRASVADLASGLGVTSATIRRDLQLLASEGRLLRTYGGAAVPARRSARDTKAPGRNGERAAGDAQRIGDRSTIG